MCSWKTIISRECKCEKCHLKIILLQDQTIRRDSSHMIIIYQGSKSDTCIDININKRDGCIIYRRHSRYHWYLRLELQVRMRSDTPKPVKTTAIQGAIFFGWDVAGVVCHSSAAMKWVGNPMVPSIYTILVLLHARGFRVRARWICAYLNGLSRER